jgi:hypothetical protein
VNPQARIARRPCSTAAPTARAGHDRRRRPRASPAFDIDIEPDAGRVLRTDSFPKRAVSAFPEPGCAAVDGAACRVPPDQVRRGHRQGLRIPDAESARAPLAQVPTRGAPEARVAIPLHGQRESACLACELPAAPRSRATARNRWSASRTSHLQTHERGLATHGARVIGSFSSVRFSSNVGDVLEVDRAALELPELTRRHRTTSSRPEESTRPRSHRRIRDKTPPALRSARRPGERRGRPRSHARPTRCAEIWRNRRLLAEPRSAPITVMPAPRAGNPDPPIQALLRRNPRREIAARGHAFPRARDPSGALRRDRERDLLAQPRDTLVLGGWRRSPASSTAPKR